tara:strand:- start:1118 stop:1720 length:603 start_codon:yes stop_codon:yes gene_type:complete
MKKLHFLFLFLGLLSIGCTEKSAPVQDPTETTDSIKISFPSDIKKNVILSADVNRLTSGWTGYGGVSQNIDELDNASIATIKENSEVWVNSSTEMLEAIPDSLKSKPIEARVTILFTKANTLKQEASKRIVDTAAVKKEATEFYNAFQDLKLQLNLKYQKSVEDYLEEFRVENEEAREQEAERRLREAEPAQIEPDSTIQ